MDYGELKEKYGGSDDVRLSHIEGEIRVYDLSGQYIYMDGGCII